MSEPTPLSVLLINLFSEKYPAIGESHGLSVVAGAVRNRLGDRIAKLFVVDMVAHGEPGFGRALRIIRDEGINVVGIGVAYGTYSTVVAEFGAGSARHWPGVTHWWPSAAPSRRTWAVASCARSPRRRS